MALLCSVPTHANVLSCFVMCYSVVYVDCLFQVIWESQEHKKLRFTCSALTFIRVELDIAFSVRWCIFGISKTRSSTKVIGSRSRSQTSVKNVFDFHAITFRKTLHRNFIFRQNRPAVADDDFAYSDGGAVRPPSVRPSEFRRRDFATRVYLNG